MCVYSHVRFASFRQHTGIGKKCTLLGILDEQFLYNAMCEPHVCMLFDFHMVSKAVFLNVHVTYVLNKQADNSFTLENR